MKQLIVGSADLLYYLHSISDSLNDSTVVTVTL